jgi:hypothetical protein
MPDSRRSGVAGCTSPTGEYIRTKNLSVIASSRKSLPEQKLRQHVIAEHRGKIDFIAGSGYTAIILKKRPYMRFGIPYQSKIVAKIIISLKN